MASPGDEASASSSPTSSDDDSDFYGTQTEVQRANRQDRPDPRKIRHYWMKLHSRSINVLAITERMTMARNVHTINDVEEVAPARNLDDGDPSAKQSIETVAEFLARAPPLASEHLGPWLWVSNPDMKQPKPRGTGEDAYREIYDKLAGYDAKRAGIEARYPSMHKSTVTRQMNPDRTALRGFILEKAKEIGDTSGKWMLFPTIEDAPRYWRTICEAIGERKLGRTAKIATEGRDGRVRLICVYVAHFSDIVDVTRVARALLDLDLFAVDGRPLYFKPDIFTRAGLESNNKFNIAVSLYSTHEVLGLAVAKGTSNAAKRPLAAATGVRGKKSGADLAATSSVEVESFAVKALKKEDKRVEIIDDDDWLF